MPNVERLKQVRDAIATHKDKFKYEWWLSTKSKRTIARTSHLLDDNYCDTMGCIAGWALAVKGIDTCCLYANDIPEDAKAFLELNQHDANFLFYGESGYDLEPLELAIATVEDALERLDILIGIYSSSINKIELGEVCVEYDGQPLGTTDGEQILPLIQGKTIECNDPAAFEELRNSYDNVVEVEYIPQNLEPITLTEPLTTSQPNPPEPQSQNLEPIPPTTEEPPTPTDPDTPYHL